MKAAVAFLACSLACGSLWGASSLSLPALAGSRVSPAASFAFAGRRAAGAAVVAAVDAKTASAQRGRNRLLSMGLESSEAISLNPSERASRSLAQKLTDFPRALYKFSRPHTIRGTILASLTGVARALMESNSPIPYQLIPRAILGMAALLLGNAYIVGINQIFDVDIDKINKPFLPVASGEMSKRAAWGVVAFSALIGPLIVATNFGPFIFGLYMFGLLIGGLYSVPPFQFKRFPIVAGLTIACVRGFLLNFGVYYAVKEALGYPFKWNPPVIFLARFMTVFAAVIAITKDLPDVEGDVKYKINTFAARVGVKKAALFASGILGVNYLSAIGQGILAPAGVFNRPVMIGCHTLFLGYLVRSFKMLNPESKESIRRFYSRIWDIFYLEYLTYVFI